MTHTGKGWDEELETVAFPNEVWEELLKKNTDYGKFRDKPIDHRNMLEELLEGSLANGAFANPSVNGGSSSEEDRQEYGPPKTDCLFMVVLFSGTIRWLCNMFRLGFATFMYLNNHAVVVHNLDLKGVSFSQAILCNSSLPSMLLDCVGAIDGTQIEAWVPRNRQVASRGRKHTITQNVMVVCSFDMKFTYVYPGWKGSAHDGRVFNAAVSNPANNFLYSLINEFFEGFTDPFDWAGGNDNQEIAGNVVGVEPINMSPQNIQLMAQRREQMAFAMWESYEE
ncbi:hypothetical protein Vadar_034569 [Vaccinium darrowii]|uniref:Uncharacterized protein n=1 Tax=Vaccinium darrowii TaxID=229202 RepID=A0ACB7XX38_9ERIC|nr:hypothetical protein Vadar_034569 [Vaccinium darrowii]